MQRRALLTAAMAAAPALPAAAQEARVASGSVETSPPRMRLGREVEAMTCRIEAGPLDEVYLCRTAPIPYGKYGPHAGYPARPAGSARSARPEGEAAR